MELLGRDPERGRSGVRALVHRRLLELDLREINRRHQRGSVLVPSDPGEVVSAFASVGSIGDNSATTGAAGSGSGGKTSSPSRIAPGCPFSGTWPRSTSSWFGR